ncbi:MAG: DUF465 domain-containing protein [Terricaulis sp.]
MSPYIINKNKLSYCRLILAENFARAGGFTAPCWRVLSQNSRAHGAACETAERLLMDSEDGTGFDINDTPERRALKARLMEYREEHRALDSAIFALQEQSGGDALQLARLKKRKLVLRDQIKWIEDRLTPDIIA